jgi:O-antigen ligase
MIWDFLRIHSWVVANHHSGYLAILVETGVVGMFLFGIVVWQLCVHLLTMLRRAAPSRSLEIAIGILFLTFTINFTETVFLRATNFGDVLFSFLLINIFSPIPVHRHLDAPAAAWHPQII